MDRDEVLLDVEMRMEKCVEHLSGDYRGIKSGRASPGLVEGLKVDYYGSPTPLKQIANIGAPEPALLVIKPFDPSACGDIEKAILKSDIGITPQSDGKLIRLPVPPLSEEQRKKYVKLAKEKAEAQKVAIRNVRRDGNKAIDALKKEGLPEDEAERTKESIDKLTKTYVGKIDELLEKKTKELMEG
ncbi:MAG: ribosome recycling factor [Planctomycetota bacterium]|nr:MAG: ribosome recycling factor [Planctomycetota bacterium]